MSIKRYCDRCNGDVTESDKNLVDIRIKGTIVARENTAEGPKKNGLTVEYELMLGTNGTMNRGELCVACVTEILADVLRKRAAIP